VKAISDRSFWSSACLSVCLSICLSVCLSLRLSVCLSVCLSVSLSVCLYVSMSFYLSAWFLSSNFRKIHGCETEILKRSCEAKINKAKAVIFLSCLKQTAYARTFLPLFTAKYLQQTATSQNTFNLLFEPSSPISSCSFSPQNFNNFLNLHRFNFPNNHHKKLLTKNYSIMSKFNRSLISRMKNLWKRQSSFEFSLDK
jgi:hypothetical protein